MKFIFNKRKWVFLSYSISITIAEPVLYDKTNKEALKQLLSVAIICIYIEEGTHYINWCCSS